jgi:hypothetical protein
MNEPKCWRFLQVQGEIVGELVEEVVINLSPRDVRTCEDLTAAVGSTSPKLLTEYRK